MEINARSNKCKILETNQTQWNDKKNQYNSLESIHKII